MEKTAGVTPVPRNPAPQSVPESNKSNRLKRYEKSGLREVLAAGVN
jgi:hypothetical protein